MKKTKWKALNIALWIEIILSYVLPFKIVDGFQYKVGFPIPFISVYDKKIGVNPFMSMHINPLPLLVDIVIIYSVILVCVKVCNHFKHKYTMMHE